MSFPARTAMMFLLALPAAHAGSKADAKALFADYVARERAFDPSQFDLFADDATLVGFSMVDGETVTEQMPVEALRSQAPLIMAVAKVEDNVSRYDGIKVQRTDAGFTVSATRYAEHLCYTDDRFALDLEERAGKLQITELRAFVQQKSSCADALERALTALHDLVSPHLPMEMDGIRMESARIDGATFELVQRATKLSLDDPEAVAFAESVHENAPSHACYSGPSRAVLEQHGTMRYVWLAADGAPLRTVDVTLDHCWSND